jgi:hypothetical protein
MMPYHRETSGKTVNLLSISNHRWPWEHTYLTYIFNVTYVCSEWLGKNINSLPWQSTDITCL